MDEESKIDGIPEDQNGGSEEEVDSNILQEQRIESTEINQSSTIQKSGTEEMEIHKHPHHVTHKKKWGEYLLEFFMLFLAVFLGFIAENIRETNAERVHEKEYAEELYKEFYADSVAFTKKINARSDKERDCDYVYSYIKDSLLTSLPKKFYPAYTTVFYLINSYTFEPKDGVLNQLKSSGSLRYFKDAELQKLFGDISVAINNVRYRNEQEYQFFANPIKPFLLQHYDFKWVNDVRKLSPDAYYIDLLNLYLKSDTFIEAAILNLPTFNRNEAANMVMFYKTMIVSSRTLQLNDYIKTNAKILEALRKDYHLKNE
jgi:hypothetical protein